MNRYTKQTVTRLQTLAMAAASSLAGERTRGTRAYRAQLAVRLREAVRRVVAARKAEDRAAR